MFLLALLLALGPASTAVKKSNDKVRGALTALFKAEGPAKAKARTQARAAVSELIDFDGLAKATLGKHWEELKPAERAHYTEALKGAMEASYLAKMQESKGSGVNPASVKNELLGEEPQDTKVLVKSRVTSGTDSAKVDYLMEKEPKGWRAVDVVTEDVSLVETYRDQVGRLLPKKGIAGVISALEKKRKSFEAQADAPAAKAPAAEASPAPAAPAK
jgi:phospholipid transport system substrate-binding protein